MAETKSTSSVFNAAASPFSFKPSTTSSTSSASNVPATVTEESNDPEDKVPEPERKTYVFFISLSHYCLMNRRLKNWIC